MLYIDPGTGSVLFTVLIGLLGTLGFFLRGLLVKLKFIFSGGKRKGSEAGKTPFVIFSDDKRYWQTFEPVCRELDRRGFDTVYMTASPDDPALENSFEHIKAEFIGEGNKAFSKLNFLEATLFLATTPGLGVYQWKRSKKVKYYVHMFHAVREASSYRMFGLDFYDAVLLAGDYQGEDIRELEKLRGLPEKELYNIGIPYMDEMKKRLKAAENEKTGDGKKTVILAPSWGPNSIFNKYGGKIIDILLKEEYHVIVRPHPQSFTSEKELIDKLTEQYPETDSLEWNRDADNFDALRRADILISDYSGVVFDFSLVYDKPVIYADATFDNGIYDGWWLPERKMWTQETLPRIGEHVTPENFDSLPDLIERCLSDFEYSKKRKELRDEIWTHQGKGAEVAAEYIINKYKTLMKEGKEE